MKLFLHTLAAILSLSLLSGCAYISGLKNHDEGPLPTANDQQTATQPALVHPQQNPATGASKMISPITHYGN